MVNPGPIVVTLQERQEGHNIARRVVGLGYHKRLTHWTMAVGRAEELILNFDP
jgi:hypothetical protein